MFITRKAEFSASHICSSPALSQDENRRLFAEEANPNGHGHNFVLEVTIEGEANPVTGMVTDLKHVKDVIEREVVTPMDHRFLNREIPEFANTVPTTANIAVEIFRRLREPLGAPGVSLARVRLFEGPDVFVEVGSEDVD
jgi:6-pyruvoyltetrahydropterin/6-carboxytetrahydropterin synthase